MNMGKDLSERDRQQASAVSLQDLFLLACKTPSSEQEYSQALVAGLLRGMGC